MSERASRAGTAAVLSFVFSGLGQLYNGQLVKGLVIVSFSVTGILIMLAGAIIIGCQLIGKIVFSAQLVTGAALFIAGLFFICAMGIYSIFDAYRNASLR